MRWANVCFSNDRDAFTRPITCLLTHIFCLLSVYMSSGCIFVSQWKSFVGRPLTIGCFVCISSYRVSFIFSVCCLSRRCFFDCSFTRWVFCLYCIWLGLYRMVFYNVCLQIVCLHIRFSVCFSFILWGGGLRAGVLVCLHVGSPACPSTRWIFVSFFFRFRTVYPSDFMIM